MIPIHKSQRDPLSGFKQMQDATYEDNRLPKKALVEQLLREQGYLCAYCMTRIDLETMSVEHWQPRHPSALEFESKCEVNDLRKLSIDYKNMLAVCDGNQGHPKRFQHCDTLKGNRVLKYNPANQAHHPKLQIRYLKSTGKIESQDDEFNRQIGGVDGDPGILNLNLNQIKDNRLEVIRRVNHMLDKLRENASRKDIQKLLDNWQKPNSGGKLQPYAGVAIFFLELRRSHAS